MDNFAELFSKDFAPRSFGSNWSHSFRDTVLTATLCISLSSLKSVVKRANLISLEEVGRCNKKSVQKDVFNDVIVEIRCRNSLPKVFPIQNDAWKINGSNALGMGAFNRAITAVQFEILWGLLLMKIAFFFCWLLEYEIKNKKLTKAKVIRI